MPRCDYHDRVITVYDVTNSHNHYLAESRYNPLQLTGRIPAKLGGKYDF